MTEPEMNQPIATVSTSIAPADRGDAWEPEGTLTAESPAAMRAAPPGWPQLDPAALYGLAGDVVRAVDPTSEADPAAILGQLLVAFGSQIGRTAHFVVEDDTHYLNEFLAVVGATSKARKGLSWGRVQKVIEPADPDWLKFRVLNGLSSGEGLIAAVSNDRLGTDGNTIEAVADKRLLAHEPEFATVLKNIDRQGNILSATLRQAWDGRSIGTLTRKAPLRATEAHVSLIVHCTAEELRRLLSTTEVANGFVNRFLWVSARRTKLLPDGAPLDPERIADLQDRYSRAVAAARQVRTMTRTPAAKDLWHTIYCSLSDERPGLAGSLLARGEAHVMRLACIYALLDGSDRVDVPHLQAALAFWQYCEQSVLYIWGDTLGDGTADDILEAILASPATGVTRTEIRNRFQRNRAGWEIDRALSLLAQRGLAFKKMIATGGRSAEHWFPIDMAA